MNNVKFLWVRFHPVMVIPGQLFELVEKSKIPAGCSPCRLEVELSSPSLVVNFLRSGGKDLLASRSALPAGNLDTTAFSKVPLPAGAELSLGVTNLGDSPQMFSATLYFEAAGCKGFADDDLHRIIDESKMRPEDLEDEPDLLSRCWGWFRRGVAAAVADRNTKSEGHLALGEILSPARARDSFRRLVSDLVDVLEIPLEASVLYWKQIASLAHGEEASRIVSASLGVGPVDVDPGCTCKISVTLVQPFRPIRLRLTGRCHEFRIVDVKSGKKSLLPSVSPIPGIFCMEGINIGTMKYVFQDSLTIVVENRSGSVETVSGILDGEWLNKLADFGE